MAFSKRKVQKRISLSQTLQKRNKDYISQKKNKKTLLWNTIWYSLFWLFLFWFIISYIVYQKYLTDLPDVTELENFQVSQSSIIYDREWGELYRIFDENRTYIDFDEIHPHIINALVSWEDKRFWENQWVDPIWIIRAILQRITWQRETLWWTSTLTQQLVRNTIIDNRSSGETFSDGVARKIREIYLSYQITNRLSKEKIIELYLNKIWYGSNAHGIEQASKTFFWKSANDITVLEASMLASLPKWPSYYSPYNNYGRLVGYPFLYNLENEEDARQRIATKWAQEQNALIFWKFIDFINNLKYERVTESRLLLCWLKSENVDARFSIDSDGCSLMAYSDLLSFLGTLQIREWEEILWYQIGRKDFILGRMLEDDYISFDEYREALIWSFWFVFNQYREDIKHPHFVFYVREYLEEKYGKEILERGWLRIYTTLDPDAQIKAEEIIKKQADANKARFDINNAALITLDNRTWEIVAMVWGKDYFNETIQWNVNMLTSEIQPWSSFKTFVYSLAIDKELIWNKTPVYDVETTFPGWYSPKNFDGDFMGKMDITTALNYSRNIPAIKMYYLAGWEQAIIDWMERLWVTSLSRFKEEYLNTYGRNYEYGAPLSLWTGLMTPLELARAYSVYGSLGKRNDIVPVLRILDSNWLIIEEHTPENNLWVQVIDESTAYITNYILSDTSSRPAFWNNFLSLSWRPAAVKTGTSSMQYTQGWRQLILPRNLFTAWYTPQYTTVVWSGNTNWWAASPRANWLEASWPIWKEFMEYLHTWEPVLNWRKPDWVKEVNISEITGMLAPSDMDNTFITSAIFKNPPQITESWIWLKEVDLLCDGKITSETPESAIGTIQVVLLRSLRPNDPAWEYPVQEWVKSWWYNESLWSIWSFRTSFSEELCVRTWMASDIELWSNIKDWDIFISGTNILEIWYRSSIPLMYLRAYINWERILDENIDGDTRWIYNGSINIPKTLIWEAVFRIEAIDKDFNAHSVSYNIIAWVRDTSPPIISFINPENNRITQYPGWFFNLRGTVADQSYIRSINIYLNDERVRVWLTWNEFVQEIQTVWLEIWQHIIRVEAVDAAFNTWESIVELEIIPQ